MYIYQLFTINFNPMTEITSTGCIGADAKEIPLGNNQSTLIVFDICDSVYDSKTKSNENVWHNVGYVVKAGSKMASMLKKGTFVTVVGEGKVEVYEGKGKIKITARKIAIQGRGADKSSEQKTTTGPVDASDYGF